jgi:hypothetical protein
MKWLLFRIRNLALVDWRKLQHSIMLITCDVDLRMQEGIREAVIKEREECARIARGMRVQGYVQLLNPKNCHCGEEIAKEILARP